MLAPSIDCWHATRNLPAQVYDELLASALLYGSYHVYVARIWSINWIRVLDNVCLALLPNDVVSFQYPAPSVSLHAFIQFY